MLLLKLSPGDVIHGNYMRDSSIFREILNKNADSLEILWSRSGNVFRSLSIFRLLLEYKLKWRSGMTIERVLIMELM